MQMDTRQMISATEANRNFSRVARMVEEHGQLLILKNNKPKYLLIDVEGSSVLTDDERIDVVARRILERHKEAFRELAK